MKGIGIVMMVAVMFLGAGQALGAPVGDWVQVEIRTDHRGILPFYPTWASYPRKKVYAEAVKGEEYTISVRNLLARRVGLVIVVDGRNIISGKKSWLRNSERMYILGPHETGEYRGWRTGSDRVNRFYFTDAADSYAAAFGDESAMGVIAVAVYPEVERYVIMERERGPSREGSSDAAPQAPKVQGAKPDSSMENAGTGYGQEEYSPSRVVAFEPEGQSVETLLIKYEWRPTLCRLGIFACCDIPPHSRNRLWDDEGYAPPPPEHR